MATPSIPYLAQPFSPTKTSTRMFFVTAQARAAIAKASYVLEYRQGLKLIVGLIGFGKTSLLKFLEDQLRGDEQYAIGFLNNPDYKSDFAFLKAISAQFGVGPKRSNLDQRAALESRLIELYQEGKNAALLIDEANLLSGDHFEVLRQLLNFELPQAKLLQIVLAAQPEINIKLAAASRKALVSRITISSSLDTFTFEDMQGMVNHRLATVEWAGPRIETEDAWRDLYEVSAGVPRNIVKICNFAFHLAYKSGASSVAGDLLRGVAADALVDPAKSVEAGS